MNWILFLGLGACVLREPVAYSQASLTAATPEREAALHRFELGGQLADFRAACVGAGSCIYPTFGIGVGGAVNFNRFFSLDALWNETAHVSEEQSVLAGGRASEFLVGPRVELRARRYAYFLEVKPGWVHWSRVVRAPAALPSNPPAFGGKTEASADVGLGVEYSPSSRVAVRTEVSDLLVNAGNAGWNSHLQVSMGVYAGLGQALRWQPAQYDPKLNHPFFDRPNELIFSSYALALAADAITTQRFLKNGFQEEDPLARPLVKYGWSGQLAASGLEATGLTLMAYGLHRMRHHWLERGLPLCVAVVHAVLAYDNNGLRHSSPVAASAR